MTKAERKQIIGYIDTKVRYEIETLESHSRTTGNRSVSAHDLDEALRLLLTGKPRSPKPKTQRRAKDQRTYREGDQQWENPAQRSRD